MPHCGLVLVDVRVVHALEVQFAHRHVGKRRTHSHNKVIRCVRDCKSFADKTALACRQPVTAVRRLACDFEDVEQHLRTLQIPAVEPSEPALFFEYCDHRFNPLGIRNRSKPPLLCGNHCRSERSIVPLHRVTIAARAPGHLRQFRSCQTVGGRQPVAWTGHL